MLTLGPIIRAPFPNASISDGEGGKPIKLKFFSDFSGICPEWGIF